MKITPKKSLGQNFLVNEGVIEKIAAAAELQSADTIIEIGPGTGNLTKHLIGKVARLILIEKDRRLIEMLRTEFGKSAEIVEADILTLDPANLNLEAGGFKLVANLPYYITSHFFKVIFGQWPRPERLVVMVQKEVAQRIMARPPQLNLLGLSVQLYAMPTLITRVAAGSFRPVPNVDSTVMMLIPHTQPLLSPQQEKLFFILTRAAFAGKRKKLSNTLESAAQQKGVSLETVFSSAGIDPASRPQHLSLENWLHLTTIFEKESRS